MQTSGTRPGEAADERQGGIVAGFARSAASGDPDWKYRCIVSGLTRALHGCTDEELIAEAAEEPPTIGPKWDALIAAAAAFSCSNRGLAAPAWTRKPERNLDSSWSCNEAFIDDDEYAWLPAAFLQRGALCGPGECDARNSPFADWKNAR